jgi:hypothetical protein
VSQVGACARRTWGGDGIIRLVTDRVSRWLLLQVMGVGAIPNNQWRLLLILHDGGSRAIGPGYRLMSARWSVQTLDGRREVAGCTRFIAGPCVTPLHHVPLGEGRGGG